MPVSVGEGFGDLYLRFAVEFPSQEVSGSSWGMEEREALEKLLPAKPKFPREKKVRRLLFFFCFRFFY